MGISAEGFWRDGKSTCSGYFIYTDPDDGELEHDFILHRATCPSISHIIHEINECEVHAILTEWGIKNAFIAPTRKQSKELIYYEEDDEAVYVSHIVSPYGKYGCAMPRSRFRTRW